MALRAEPTPGNTTYGASTMAGGSALTSLDLPTCVMAARTERVLPAP